MFSRLLISEAFFIFFTGLFRDVFYSLYYMLKFVRIRLGRLIRSGFRFCQDVSSNVDTTSKPGYESTGQDSGC